MGTRKIDYSYKMILYASILAYFTSLRYRSICKINTVMQGLNTRCHSLHLGKDGTDMVDSDWKTFGKLPPDLIELIDDYVHSSQARKIGINSRSDFIIRLVTAFFSNYIEEFRLFMPKDLANKVNEISHTLKKYSGENIVNNNDEGHKDNDKKKYRPNVIATPIMISLVVVTVIMGLGAALVGSAMTESADADDIGRVIRIKQDIVQTVNSDNNGTNDLYELMSNGGLVRMYPLTVQ